MQQINLYSHLKKTPRLFLTLEKLLLLYGVFFLFLMSHLTFSYSIKSGLIDQVDELTKTYSAKQVLLESTKQKYPGIGASDIFSVMMQLQKELATKGQMLSIFSQNTRFSTILTALGKAIVPGVWLTDIKITDSGQKIILVGKANQATLPQSFMEQLKRQTPFDKMRIQLNEVTQTVDSKTDSVESTFSVTADTVTGAAK